MIRGCFDLKALRAFDEDIHHTGRPLLEAINQLSTPDVGRPIFVDNIAVRLDRDIGLELPLSLECRNTINPEKEPTSASNITPQGTIVDLHVDHGFTVLATTIEDCVKMWALFPPTEHNLGLLRKVANKSGGLQLLVEDHLQYSQPFLEGGILTRTDSAEAILLPAGTLHAVFTLSGGFLSGIHFLTAESTYQTALCLRYEIQCKLGIESPDEVSEHTVPAFGELEGDVARYAESLELALRYPVHRKDAIRGWILVEPFMKTWVSTAAKAGFHEIWRNNLGWLGHFTYANAGVGKCACGWDRGDDFFLHFKGHLTFLDKSWLLVEQTSMAGQGKRRSSRKHGRY
ncbi:MAG: hypothetical protein Q9164_004134 [Protoblastenia rupestris]